MTEWAALLGSNLLEGKLSNACALGGMLDGNGAVERAIGMAYSGLICTLRNFTTPLPH